MKRSRLKPVSAKRAAQQDEWEAVKARVYERDYGLCQFWQVVDPGLFAVFGLPVYTHGGPFDPHHIWPTGEGGPRLLDANVVTLCRQHHNWCHANRAKATELGLMARGPHWENDA